MNLSQVLSQVRLDETLADHAAAVLNAGDAEPFIHTCTQQQAAPLLSASQGTPDFITPQEQQFQVGWESGKENVSVNMVQSPARITPIRTKRPRASQLSATPSSIRSSPSSSTEYFGPTPGRRMHTPMSATGGRPPPGAVSTSTPSATQSTQYAIHHPHHHHHAHGSKGKLATTHTQRGPRRPRSPPYYPNPYLSSEDAHANVPTPTKPAVPVRMSPWLAGTSRYRDEFIELKELGRGSFGKVMLVRKKIDGCLYAVKRSAKQLLEDSERKLARREVQALAACPCVENLIRYYSAWYESDHLYIQLELCEGSLAGQLAHLAQGLCTLHEAGIAHMDVKPENVYHRRGVYKLGDMGRACALDGVRVPVEDGDVRYLPMEIMNDDYRHLDRADVFSLGATVYEIAKRTPLPKDGPTFQDMMHPDPTQRPSAEEVLTSPLLNDGSMTCSL
eukprot:jgi/Chlat1/8569/Chrsp82S07955